MLTLTKKYERDCMHYFNKDNSDEWLELQARHHSHATIDPKNDVISFFVLFKDTGHFSSSFTMKFSYKAKKFIEFHWTDAKTVKTKNVGEMMDAYTAFVTDMIKHGFLERD